MKRTILNTAIAAMLLLCTSPALRAQTPSLRVGSNMVPLNASGNVTGNGISGTVHYNHTDNTITLTDATITATGSYNGIYSSVEGLKIVLQGNNNKIEANSSAINHTKPLTIKGSGRLEAISAAAAIYVDRTDLTIEGGCTVIARGGNGGIAGNNTSTSILLTIRNSTVKAKMTGTNNAYGSIDGFNDLVLDDCSITYPTGAAYNTTRKAVCLNGELVTEVEIIAAYFLYIAGNNVNLTTTGNVTGSGITSAAGSVHYNHTTNTLTLNDATITTRNKGIYSSVNGLKIVLQGNNNKIEADPAAISHDKPLTIKGTGKLEATSIYNAAIYAYQTSLTIKDGCTLEVISPNNTAIYADGTNLTIEGGCTVIATGKWGISGGGGSTSVLTIKNSTVKATSTSGGSITRFNNLVLVGCSITAPEGAAYNTTQDPKGVYLNNTLVRDTVVIMPPPPTVNTSRYITLTVTPGDSITLDLWADAPNTGVKVESGTSSTTLTVGTSWSDSKKYHAQAATMKVYGNLKAFNCSNNGTKVKGIDASNNNVLKYLLCYGNSLRSLNVSGCTALEYLYCHNNNLTAAGLDSIYCSLPQRQPGDDARIQPVFNASSTNHATVLETNKANATAKNWKVQYYQGDTDIPATSGTYSCSPTTGIEQLQANGAAARIYPNPVGDLLTIETDETIEALQLFDLAGKLLLSQTPQSKTHTLDVSTLQSGVYMLKLRTKKGTGEYKVVKK